MTVKRFFSDVEVEGAEGCFTVALDGRNVRTPERMPIRLPTMALAQAVAGEWRAQGNAVVPDTMPMTRLANTAIDLVAASRQKVIDKIAGFVTTELLCSRAEEPADLVKRQADAWQPLLDWAGERYDLHLRVGAGVNPIEQSEESLPGVAAVVAVYEDFALAALYSATLASGSVLIGLALAEGAIGVEAAWTCADLNDAWRAERSREDPEMTRRREGMRAEMLVAGRFFELCRPPS